jgi:hypothetical protein
VSGYIACCCEPGFRIHIRNTLEIEWTLDRFSFGEADPTEFQVGQQVLSVETTRSVAEQSVTDRGSSISYQRFLDGTISRSRGPFVDLNDLTPGGFRRVPASPPSFFPGIQIRTIGDSSVDDCLDLKPGEIYITSSLNTVADPGDFDNGSAGWTATNYDFNGNPTGSETRRGTPIQGFSPGLIRIRVAGGFGRAYRVFDDVPINEQDFLEDLGIFDPTPDAFLLPDPVLFDFRNQTILPEFQVTIDGISFDREQVQLRAPEFICALRACEELNLRETVVEDTFGGQTITTIQANTIRNSEILDYEVL